MIRFKRQLAIAFAVFAAAFFGTPSSAEQLTAQPGATPPRNPPDNGPRDVGGAYGSPGYHTENDYYSYSSRGTAILDVLANDTYPAGAKWSYDNAGYAYLSYIDCPDSDRVCIYYEPVGGDRPYPDRITYDLRDSQGKPKAGGEAYVTMP